MHLTASMLGQQAHDEGPVTGVTGPFFALEVLEFPALLEQVAARAVSAAGADRIRARRPSLAVDTIAENLASVEELARCLREEDGFRPMAASPIEEILDHLAVEGSMLDATELRTLANAVDAMHRTDRGLRALRDRAPRACQLLVELPPTSLEKSIRNTIDDDETVLDGASPNLAKVRRKLRGQRAELVKKLEALLRKIDGVGTRAEVTVREGRYVIPIRKGGRGEILGVVHDESSSGATMFVEPTEAIPLGNAIRSYEREERQEVRRILLRLTAEAREAVGSLHAGWEMLVGVDDLYARARYAVDVEGVRPVIVSAPAALSLRRARHPLLLAQVPDGQEVVPFDLHLDLGERTVLISGPNAGGKTVLMKAVGLIAAMTQSGIIPPVDERSQVPVFRALFADIGDQQSIAANLSTFSAHLRAMKTVVERADAGALVLIDEIGSGTDPAEGAALAEAVLSRLGDRGALTLATTHFSSLKRLAENRDEVVNASLQFDTESLRPTFRLLKDLPGRSYGIAIAERLGLDPEVVDRAREALDDDHLRLDGLLAELETRRAELDERLAVLEEREASVMSRGDALTERESVLVAAGRQTRERERRLEKEGREEARRYLLDARKKVEAALVQARQAVDEVTAREARRLVEDAARAEQEAAQDLVTDGSRPDEVVVGARVRVPGGSPGTVLEVRADGRIAVDCRGVRLVLEGASVEPLDGPVAEPVEPVRITPSFEPEAIQTTVDLRGMRADEAEAVLFRAIDEALLADLSELRIIHGKGTGALRECVHALLRNDARVTRFGVARPEQGGSGVTHAEFQL